MKLKFAKSLKLTTAQKARLQRFEDRSEALLKREDQFLADTDRVNDQYRDLLDKLGAAEVFIGKSLTVVPLGKY